MKWIGLFFLLVPTIAYAGAYRTILNPFTGRQDYVNNLSSTSVGVLADISTSPANNGDVLTYSSSTSKFSPKAASGGGGYAVEPATVAFQLNQGVSVSTVVASSITVNTYFRSNGKTVFDQGAILWGTAGTPLNGTHVIDLSDSGVGRGDYCTILGGQGNQATNQQGVIAGGAFHSIASDFGFIGGGYQNTISGTYGAVTGGNNNIAYGLAFVGGGQQNVAKGQYSTVPGGIFNEAWGQSSFTAGSSMKGTGDNLFLFGTAPVPFTQVTITQANSFIIYNSSVGINNVAPQYILDVIGTARVVADVAASKPLIVQGATSQSANLEEWQGSDGTIYSVVDSTGTLGLKSLTANQIHAAAPSRTGLKVYCSNCTTCLEAISTGTAAGAWASSNAANRTTFCQ